MTANFNQFDWHRQMIRSGDLNTTAKLVGAAMFDYSDEHGRNVFPSKATLAEDTGLSKSAVHRAIHRLRDTGWIRLVAEGGFSDQYNRPNEWRLTYPANLPNTSKPGGGVTSATGGVSPALPPGYHQRYPGGVTSDTQTDHLTTQEQIRDNSSRPFVPKLAATGGGFGGGFGDGPRDEFDPWSGQPSPESWKCADCQRIGGGFGCHNCHAA